MAAEEAGWDPGQEGGVIQDKIPALPAFPEADSADPGGERSDDTRQDRAPKAYGEDLCGLWVRKEKGYKTKWMERGIGFRIRDKTKEEKHGSASASDPPACMK